MTARKKSKPKVTKPLGRKPASGTLMKLPPPEDPKLKPDAFLAFQMWKATPLDRRMPSTQAALAKQLGVHEWTLTHWKKDPAFWDGVRVLSMSSFTDRLADVINALADAVVRRDRGWLTAARLFLECAGIIKQGDMGIQVGMLVQMTPTERGDLQQSILVKAGLKPMSPGITAGDLGADVHS